MKRIESLLDAYSQAVYQKDIDQLMTLYTDDVVVFDAFDNWEYRGKAAWGEAVERWFTDLGDDLMRITFNQTHVEFDDNVGGLSAEVHFEGISAVKDYAMTNRITLGLRREGNDWKISHEHTSLPVKQTTGQSFRRED